jgi:hypothetical protein
MADFILVIQIIAKNKKPASSPQPPDTSLQAPKATFWQLLIAEKS